TTSLNANKILIQNLIPNTTFLKIYQHHQHLLQHLLIQNKHPIQMPQIYTHILTPIINTFTSLISNNLNTLIKFLTSITIIL
ncbi:CorA family divalent cation transporter, partial [Bacillus thuringiensis]|uniref:CorA family divalent cation transporter n=1 Tax=Bacillus thuringiensis TaxID=1428 RepID=UPI0030F4210D